MSLKDRGNVPSGISSMSKSSDIVSILYIDSCVVSWFPLLLHRDSASAATFFSPDIYSISGPYSPNIIHDRNTLSVLKFLRLTFYDQYIFLIVGLIKLCEIPFKVLTILSNSISVTVSRFCGPVSLWM